ncbi:protein EFR3 homolog B-like isoform X1 [Lampetra fluviatilis]
MQSLLCSSVPCSASEVQACGSEGAALLLGVCGCFGAFRPRYKVLVDSIYPINPQDGLVKPSMERLTFYAVSAPEKLDRIGSYLSARLSRDVARRRHEYVVISMEALDKLLMACHSQCINHFVESFLKMVQKLLESNEPQLQILGTNSFVKFANIEEDTPSYHRQYDFLVSKFSAMCHSNIEDPTTCTDIRMSGLKGLQGVVRKTVKDELQANIWEPQHMDKIVPSLLFNMQHADSSEGQTPGSPAPMEQEKPESLAESCLRELLSRAAYGNIDSIIRPVLMHLDGHSLWDPNTFAVRCFKIIMYSVQNQHAHMVLQKLLGHLDTHSKARATVRAGVVQVLSETVSIAAGGSIGPAVLEVFNSLLKHLRLSVDQELRWSNVGGQDDSAMDGASAEAMFQDSVVKTIGSFAGILPDYQRSEIMMFIMGKMPLHGVGVDMGSTGEKEQADHMYQVMLLRSVLKVVPEHKAAGSLLLALPGPVLEPLLWPALLEEAEARVLALRVLHGLLDRHHNRDKLTAVRIVHDLASLKLKMEKCSKQDATFMKKNGQRLYGWLYESCVAEGNTRAHYEALYVTLALLALETGGEEFVAIDLVRLAVALQEAALEEESCSSVFARCATHGVVAAFLSLLAQRPALRPLLQHVTAVVEHRRKVAPYLLPDVALAENPRLPSGTPKEDKTLLFLPSVMAEALQIAGLNGERVTVPFVPLLHDEDARSHRKSIVDTVSMQLDLEWNEGTDVGQVEEITFEMLKNAMVDSASRDEQEKEKRRKVMEKFQKAPFEEIAAQCEARAAMLQSKYDQIFEINIRPPPSPSGSVPGKLGQIPCRSVPVYEMTFPDLCVY